MPIKMLKLVDLNPSDKVQSRYETDSETVERYREIYESKEDEFPPCIIFQEGDKYHVADGFQRIKALTKARLDKKVEYRTIACDVRQGTERDAIEYSLAANSRHGLKPNTRDKKRSVMMYWGLSPIHCKHSSNLVGKACGVSHTFVADYRADVLHNLPSTEIFEQTRVPLIQIGEIILWLKQAEEDGEIITVRNGKELVQKVSREPAKEPLQMPLQTSVTPAQPKYIVTRPQTTNIATIGTIHRGVIVSGVESLTDTGKVAINYRDKIILIPGEDLIPLPYSIGDLVSPIDDDTELAVTDFALICDDLKVKCNDSNGYAHTHSSTLLRSFIKKSLYPEKKIPQVPQNNIDAADKPATPILDLLKLTDDELLELQFQVEQETLRRARLSEDTADLSIS
jgi:hypothetical protein